MLGISFIKILFIQSVTTFKSCFDSLGSDCYNNGWSISNRLDECLAYKFMGRFGQGTQLTQTDPIDRFQVYQDNILLDSIIYDVHQGAYIQFYITKSYPFTTPKDKQTITIKITRYFDEAISNESWGMRNVYIEVLDPCVDFFNECNYQGTLWRICAGNQTSLARDIPFTIKSVEILDGKIAK